MKIIQSGCFYSYRHFYSGVGLDHTLRTGTGELDPVLVFALSVQYLVLSWVVVRVLEDRFQSVVVVDKRPFEV